MITIYIINEYKYLNICMINIRNIINVIMIMTVCDYLCRCLVVLFVVVPTAHHMRNPMTSRTRTEQNMFSVLYLSSSVI